MTRYPLTNSTNIPKLMSPSRALRKQTKPSSVQWKMVE